jgi:DNA repair protein RecO (recombination protein O)
MATYKARGIILNRKNLFEADRIITVLTKHSGKLRVIAKGVRRHLSKNAGSVELFVVCDLILAKGRNFDIITSAEIVKNFKNIRNNLSKTALAYKMAEMIDKILTEDQEHEEVYDFTKKVLEYLDQMSFKRENLIFEYFALNLLSMVGFAPELYVCLGCGKKLPNQNNFFDVSEGGILCQDCARSGKIVLEVSPNQIKLLRIFLKQSILILKKLRLKKNDIIFFKKIIKNFIEYILEKELKSDKFLKKVESF